MKEFVIRTSLRNNYHRTLLKKAFKSIRLRFGKKELVTEYKIRIFEQADNVRSNYEERTELD